MSAPPHELPGPPRDAVVVAAVLFDLDGTLVDTSRAVEAAWRWAAAELAVPFARVQPFIHGIPVSQALDEAVADLDTDRRAYLAQGVLERVSAEDAEVSAMHGARALLKGLPPGRWAIVTSGDRRMARATMRKAALPEPDVLVTSEDVTVGKPDPEPFLHAADALGVPGRDCLVVEDSPAGIRAARGAGMRVLAVATTFPVEALRAADWILPDLHSLLVCAAAEGVVVSARPPAPLADG